MATFTATANHHAVLFAYLTKEAVDGFGHETADPIVEEAICAYGRQRGRRMGMRCEADGFARDVLGYITYGEWEAQPGQMDIRFPAFGPEANMQIWKCPWNEEWKRLGLLEYAKPYCQYVDAALVEGFNPRMKLEMTQNRSFGAECCNFIFLKNAVAEKDIPQIETRRARLGSKAKMPWDYHIGHLYKTMRAILIKAFGDEGANACDKALKAYASQYGEAAGERVLACMDIDYDTLPAYAGIDAQAEA